MQCPWRCALACLQRLLEVGRVRRIEHGMPMTCDLYDEVIAQRLGLDVCRTRRVGLDFTLQERRAQYADQLGKPAAVDAGVQVEMHGTPLRRVAWQKKPGGTRRDCRPVPLSCAPMSRAGRGRPAWGVHVPTRLTTGTDPA